jgi:hypothetical protein
MATERVKLADGVFAQQLIPGVAPLNKTAKAIARKRKARTLRRLHLPALEDGLWDETERDSQELF